MHGPVVSGTDGLTPCERRFGKIKVQPCGALVLSKLGGPGAELVESDASNMHPTRARQRSDASGWSQHLLRQSFVARLRLSDIILLSPVGSHVE